MVCDLPTAETVKVAANAFLATKISFVNAMAELCDASGADVGLLADAIRHDPRIGRQYLDAGLGFGGGCLPKDIRRFIARAEELGADQTMNFLREVDAINMCQRQRMVELAVTECDGAVLGSRIAVLGAAFKPDSDVRCRRNVASTQAGSARCGIHMVSGPQGRVSASRVTR